MYFCEFLNKQKLYDLARNKNESTFERFEKTKTIKRRLDGWFATKKVRKLVCVYRVIKESEINSDHKPVKVKIEWEEVPELASPGGFLGARGLGNFR